VKSPHASGPFAFGSLEPSEGILAAQPQTSAESRYDACPNGMEISGSENLLAAEKGRSGEKGHTRWAVNPLQHLWVNQDCKGEEGEEVPRR